jgi:hypothetical protein
VVVEYGGLLASILKASFDLPSFNSSLLILDPYRL